MTNCCVSREGMKRAVEEEIGVAIEGRGFRVCEM